MPNIQIIHKASKEQFTDIGLVCGGKLDTIVANQVLGLEVVEERWGKNKEYGCLSLGTPEYYDSAGEMILSNPLPDYSNDMNDAWLVVEHMQTKEDPHGRPWKLELYVSGAHTWHASFELDNDNAADDVTHGTGKGSTAAEAICRAALDAVEYYRALDF